MGAGVSLTGGAGGSLTGRAPRGISLLVACNRLLACSGGRRGPPAGLVDTRVLRRALREARRADCLRAVTSPHEHRVAMRQWPSVRLGIDVGQLLRRGQQRVAV